MKKKMKVCEMCGEEKPTTAFSKSYRNRCKECVAEQARIKRMNDNLNRYFKEMRVPRLLPTEAPAKWELYRVELIKVALPAMVQVYYTEHIRHLTEIGKTASFPNVVALVDSIIEDMKRTIQEPSKDE